MSNQDRLISHTVSPEDIKQTVEKVRERIIKTGDKAHVTVERQLDLLTQLSQFDFGRFLLQNQGINGYWTHYLLMYPRFGAEKPLSDLERFILERAPGFLATQQRFEIFLKEIQKSVVNNATLACIPCGMMGELLYLDFTGIKNIHLVGIDYDPETLKDAEGLAEKLKLSQFVECRQGDAWDLNINKAFDLISSNGLNIYEPDDNKVTALYHQFYQALKPGGKLVTSAITPRPDLTEHCEWVMDNVNREDLLLQRIIFSDILDAKWQAYRSTELTKKQLESAGFKEIKLIYDKAHIFPTVTAIRQ